MIHFKRIHVNVIRVRVKTKITYIYTYETLVGCFQTAFFYPRLSNCLLNNRSERKNKFLQEKSELQLLYYQNDDSIGITQYFLCNNDQEIDKTKIGELNSLPKEVNSNFDSFHGRYIFCDVQHTSVHHTASWNKNFLPSLDTKYSSPRTLSTSVTSTFNSIVIPLSEAILRMIVCT